MTRCKKNAFVAGLLAVLAASSSMAQIAPGLARLPLYFAADQAGDGSPQFHARGSAQDVLISDHTVQINLRDGKSVQVDFPGASSHAQIHGEAELGGKINFLTGNDPSRWHTGIPTFARIQVNDLYPGINTVYYGNDRQLEYDFTVAAGTSPKAICMRFGGSADISLNAQGDLAVNSGDVLLHKPFIYQTLNGERREITGGYAIAAGHTVTFNIGAYDHSQPLVIDPLLTYSSFLGGNGSEEARAIAINTNDGSIFLAGQTLARNLATTNGIYQTTNHGTVGNAFVAKFQPQGTNMELVYITYIGGSIQDQANAMAVDPSGNVYLGGITLSPNFPVTNSILKMGGVPGLTNHIGGVINPYTETYFPDAFVTELAAGGSNLVFSTFVGGSGEDAIEAIALDSANNIYFTGYTLSTNLPTTNAVNFTLVGNLTKPSLNYLACTNTYFNCNAFIGKIAASGAGLDYLSYFGGQNFDVGTGIAVDGAANVYVTGFTDSTNFPNFNSFQPYLNSGLNISNSVNYIYDAFVAKFGPTTTSPPLLYSSFLGNTNTDQAYAIAVDAEGAAYVTGVTASTNFVNTTAVPTFNAAGDTTNVQYTVIANRLTNNVLGIIYSSNVFLTKIVTTNLNYPNRAYIAKSVVFGGSHNDVGNGVAVDPAGNIFVTGSVNSFDFPTNNAYGNLTPLYQGANDVFITAFNSTFSNVLYSAYLGGGGNDVAYGIAVDSQSTVYLAGQTYSGNFPVTTNTANFPIYAGRVKTFTVGNQGYDAFLSIITLNVNGPFPLAITPVKTNEVALSWTFNTNIYPAMRFYSLQANTNLGSTNWVNVTNSVTVTSSLVTNKGSGLSTNFTYVTNSFTLTNNTRRLVLPRVDSEFFRLNTN